MNFVRIESVYTDKSLRTTGELSRAYDNKALLKDKIASIVKGILVDKAINGKKNTPKA